MPKQVEKTDRIKALIAKSYGDNEVNVEDFAVFEARSFNTRPVQKKGTLWEGAIHSSSFLSEMAATFNASGQTVPILIQHRSGLPVGQAFHAEVVGGPDGHQDLNVLFYLPKTETDLVRRLDAGVVKEVSVGVRSKGLLCNKCGFDFMAEEVGWEQLYSRTCDNGHTVGKEGTHLIASGLDRWFELSLVDRGAAQGTAILPRSQQVIADRQRLAASGIDTKRPYLIASFDEGAPDTSPPKEKHVEDLVNLKAEMIVKDRDLKAAADQVTALTAQVAELTAKVADAAALDAVALKASNDAAMAFLGEVATASLAALGRASEALPEKVEDRIKLVQDARAQLALVIPTGGASRAAEADDTEPTKAPNLAAFKTR